MGDRADQQGLQDLTDLTDRVRHLLDGLFGDPAAGIVGIGTDIAGGQLDNRAR